MNRAVRIIVIAFYPFFDYENTFIDDSVFYWRNGSITRVW